MSGSARCCSPVPTLVHKKRPTKQVGGARPVTLSLLNIVLRIVAGPPPGPKDTEEMPVVKPTGPLLANKVRTPHSAICALLLDEQDKERGNAEIDRRAKEAAGENTKQVGGTQYQSSKTTIGHRIFEHPIFRCLGPKWKIFPNISSHKIEQQEMTPNHVSRSPCVSPRSFSMEQHGKTPPKIPKSSRETC